MLLTVITLPISWLWFPWIETCRRIFNIDRYIYRGADMSLARPGKKQANVSVRMAWISFGALPCRKKKTWQLASRCCRNRARPWHASELVSFLVGLRTYQHPGIVVLLSGINYYIIAIHNGMAPVKMSIPLFFACLHYRLASVYSRNILKFRGKFLLHGLGILQALVLRMTEML